MAPPFIDIIHRSFVLGLVGISGYGLFMGWKVHEDTLRRGKGVFVLFWSPRVLIYAPYRGKPPRII